MTEPSNEQRQQVPVHRAVTLKPPAISGDPGTLPQAKRSGRTLPKIRFPKIHLPGLGALRALKLILGMPLKSLRALGALRALKLILGMPLKPLRALGALRGLKPASILSLLVSPYLLLILTMLFWSGNWIFGRMMRGEMTPLAFAYWRWLAALIIIYPFAFRHLRADQAIIFRHWKLLLLFGALGVGGFHTMIYTALSTTTVVNASLVNSAIPIAIVCISWVMFRETVTWKQVLGILTSLVGVVIIVARGQPDVLLNLTVNKGDLWAMAAVPVWGLYSVLLKRRPADLHPMAFLGAIMIFGVLLLTPFFFWELVTKAPPPPSLNTLIGVAYVAVFSSVLAYIFWNRAVGMVGANKAGQFVHLLPVFATGLAVLLLGEALHLYHIAGIVLIFAGIYLATIFGAPSVPAAQAGD